MKYVGMPMGMWALFAKSFQGQLMTVFGYDGDTARKVTKIAKSNTRRLL